MFNTWLIKLYIKKPFYQLFLFAKAQLVTGFSVEGKFIMRNGWGGRGGVLSTREGRVIAASSILSFHSYTAINEIT